MLDNAQRSPGSHGFSDESSSPEAEAFFNSVLERYAQDATLAGSTTGAPAAPEFVLCAGCGSSMPAMNRLCYVCGTVRPESDAANVRIATPAPDLRVNKQPAYRPLAPEPQPPEAPSAKSAEGVADSGASLFETYYRPSPTEPRSEEEEEKTNYRPFIVGVLAALLVLAATVLMGNARDAAGNVFAAFQRTVASELAQLWSGTLAVPPAPRTGTRADGIVHVDARRIVRGARSEQGPAPRSTGLSVWVQGQPGHSSPAAFPPTASGGAREYLVPGAAPGGHPENPPAATGVADMSPLAVRISPRESLQLLMKQVPPVYPAAARAAHIQGQVVLKAIIGRDGRISHLEALSGEELLVPAAIEAVRQWLYRPYLVDGLPQEVETMIVLDFSLADARAAAVKPPVAALP